MIRKRRGVSPVIATVLLVGMVIALALIIFVWFKSFTKETITKFEGENVELVCGRVEFQASYDGTSIDVSNTGNVPIYDIRVKSSDIGGYETENMRDNSGWPTIGLNPGEAASISFNKEGVSLIPILLGNSEKGKKTFACENQEYEL